MTEHTEPAHQKQLDEMIAFTVQHLDLDLEPTKAAEESLVALGIDSLELLSLIGALEESFGVSFDPDRLQNADTTGKPLTLRETLRLMASIK
jgi:acyl carrier protein